MENKIDIEELFSSFADTDTQDDFKKKMIEVGVVYGVPIIKKFATEYVPEIVKKVKADKEIKKQEKKEIIQGYKDLIKEIKFRTKNDLSMSTQEYLACLDKIEVLEGKIKELQKNKTAKYIGIGAMAVATGGFSLLAGFIISKTKKTKKED